jgi:hypothetical protein
MEENLLIAEDVDKEEFAGLSYPINGSVRLSEVERPSSFDGKTNLS